MSGETKGKFKDTNFPVQADGSLYHLGNKPGDVANRVLVVGDAGRAERISHLFDSEAEVKHVKSSRGFVIFTGMYNGVSVSVVTSLMGFPNMDFAVRELKYYVKGTMWMIRLGTCGCLKAEHGVGKLIIPSKGAVACLRNPDAFRADSTAEPYLISRPVTPDAALTAKLTECMVKHIGKEGVVTDCMNASSDSFYSSQGRRDSNFDDKNEGLIDRIHEQYPDLVSMEMETFHLFDLADCSRGGVRASASAIALGNRIINKVISSTELHDLEVKSGRACLEALSQIS